MNFNDYQKKATVTAIFNKDYEVMIVPKKEDGSLDMSRGQLAPWVYPALGLGNEPGEVLGKLKKVIRDSQGVITPDIRAKLQAELGDCLWYLAVLAQHLNISLEDCAIDNIEKLSGRMERGTLKGSGDVR